VLEQAGILTVTVELLLELDGSAVRTSDSEQDCAVQLEPAQDCAKPRAQNTGTVEHKSIKTTEYRRKKSSLIFLQPQTAVFIPHRRV
jgi:hypothetical protein